MGVIERGKTLFMQRCSQCHTVEIDNKLHTDLPRSASEPTSECKSMQFFAYKYIAADNGGENSLSTPESLKQYSQQPKKYVPGREIILVGIKKKNERVSLLAYLQALNCL